MILNPKQSIAIDLSAWHYWFPVWPIRITCRDSRGNGEVRVWRWLYTVQRKLVYIDSDGDYRLAWIDYRDLIS